MLFVVDLYTAGGVTFYEILDVTNGRSSIIQTGQVTSKVGVRVRILDFS